MKKFTVLLLLIAMIFILSSCGAEQSSKEISEPQITDDIPAPTESDIVSDEGIDIQKTINVGNTESFNIKYNTKTHKLELSNTNKVNKRFLADIGYYKDEPFITCTYYVDATQVKKGSSIIISGKLKQLSEKIDVSDPDTFLDLVREEQDEETIEYYESTVEGLTLSGEECEKEIYKRDVLIEISFAGNDSIEYFQFNYKRLDSEVNVEEKYKVSSNVLSEIEYYNDGEISQRIICNADGSHYKFICYVDGKVDEEYLLDEDGYFIKEE